ncbi:MAG: putative sensor domain DACNV-containing protein [Planctomycetaceae bacterium]
MRTELARGTGRAPRAAWQYDFPDGDCSIRELEAVLLDYRAWARGAGQDRTGALSDAALSDLIDLAYHASMRAEEGRFLTLRLFVDRAGQSSPLLARFERPIPLTAHALAKLAPAVASLEHALHLVEERGAPSDGHARASSLLCDGIVSLIDIGLDPTAGSLPGTPHNLIQFPGGMVLTVDGPGILRVHEGISVQYAAGRLQHAWPYVTIRPVEESFRSVAASILGRLVEKFGDEVRIDFGGQEALAGLVQDSWSQILQTAIAARHGAMFAVLQDPDAADVHVRHRLATLDLRDSLFDFWASCVKAYRSAKGPDMDQEAIHAWQRAKVRARAVTRAVGNLSQVDGCVVLNAQLQVTGFGGVIGGRGAGDAACQCALADPRTLQPQGYVTLAELGLGTRHQSAYRLCDEQAGTLAYVVSQDGGMRLFYGDGERVYLWHTQGLRGAAGDLI